MAKIKLRGRKPKYSYKQMWRYASQSKMGSTKQIRWVRRLYDQKIREAERKGQTGRANWLRSKRMDLAVNAKKYGVKPQTWSIASEKDLMDLALYGKVNEKQHKLLILDNDNNAILIAYEGTAEYDEAMKLKEEIFGK